MTENYIKTPAMNIYVFKWKIQFKYTAFYTSLHNHNLWSLSKE